MKIFITLSLLYLTLANQEILSVVGDQKYPFQQVIVALSEVALKDFNFQQLFVALDELAESFKGRKNEENAFYRLLKKLLKKYKINLFKFQNTQKLNFFCMIKNINNIMLIYNTTTSSNNFCVYFQSQIFNLQVHQSTYSQQNQIRTPNKCIKIKLQTSRIRLHNQKLMQKI